MLNTRNPVCHTVDTCMMATCSDLKGSIRSFWALAAAKASGSKVQKLKRVCKAATIAIPPSVYTRVKSEEDVIQRLEDLLSKYGLAKDSSAEEVAQVKRNLKKERDLDGEPGCHI